ncbi:MAG: cytochrome c oxidase assembly protein [Rhodospirillales bacterium]
MAKTRRKNRIAAALLFTVAGGMVGMAFAAVPLYQWFCQATGFAGTPNGAAVLPAAPPSTKTITIRFDANVNNDLPWRFQPEQSQITVRAGESALAFFKAANRSDRPITGTATFNVSPYKAGVYFSKTDCFCFTEQRLAAGEEAEMGVQFFVDPGIFEDPNTKELNTITLSYTFFRAPGGDVGDGEDKAEQATAPQPGRPAKG